MFFKYPKYKYTPSFEYKTNSKLVVLKNKYQNLFLSFIENKEIDNVILYEGIKEISNYITEGIFYQLQEDYQSKSSLSKKIEVLINKTLENYSIDELRKEILMLAEESVYESIGLGNSNNVFKQTTPNSNLILFTKNKLFFKVINYLSNKTNIENHLLFNVEERDTVEQIEREDYIDDLLDRSRLSKALDKTVINRIKECLLNESIESDIESYIEFLINFKEN